MYLNVLNYLKKKNQALKNQNFTSRRIKIVKKLSKRYKLFSFVIINYFLFTKNNERNSICIIEKKIFKFLHTIHKNHEHYFTTLILNFLIKRVY